jgi:hypothetical protein
MAVMDAGFQLDPSLSNSFNLLGSKIRSWERRRWIPRAWPIEIPNQIPNQMEEEHEYTFTRITFSIARYVQEGSNQSDIFRIRRFGSPSDILVDSVVLLVFH